MVVELSSSWTVAEYRMAVARIKNAQPDAAQRKLLRLIVVATENEQPPLPVADGVRLILRPNIISDDPEPCVEALANAMR